MNEVAQALDYAQARALVEHAMHRASMAGLAVAVAVVDEGAQLLAFGKSKGAFPAAAELSIAKARTAAMFRRDTQDMQQSLESGRLSYLALPGTVPLAGAVPLGSKTCVIGAIGISGAASSEDARLVREVAAGAGLLAVRS